jgi:hypothetical protein
VSNSDQLKLWILGFVLVCLVAWAGHGATPPSPPVPKRPHKSAAIHQGAGAAKLISKIVPSISRTNTFTWLYPPGLDPSQFWWNIESSTDLKNWTVLVTNASGPYSVNVNKSTPLSIYRLRAKLTP